MPLLNFTWSHRNARVMIRWHTYTHSRWFRELLFFFLSCLTGDLELRAFSPQELSIDRVNNAIVIGMKNSSQRATDSISDGNDVFYFATDKMIPCGYFLLFMELEVPWCCILLWYIADLIGMTRKATLFYIGLAIKFTKQKYKIQFHMTSLAD